MKRVLFIDAGDPYKKIAERFHPLWPAYLASYVDAHFGKGQFTFRLMSLNAEKEIRSFRPELVAISSVSPNYNHAIKCARIAKHYGLPVIIGGIHISTLPQTLTKDMDIGCIGEGGDTFTEILQHYVDYGGVRLEKLAEIKGIVYRENGALKRTPDRPIYSSLDRLPHPKRSLIEYHRTDTMLTSRGCPYRCPYCSVARYWDNIGYASPEYVVDEITELVTHGTKIIKFYDDLFPASKKRVEAIASGIIEKRLHRRARFTCWARADSITPEVVAVLKSMNMVAVEMGLESGCERSLNYLKGGTLTVQENRRAVNLLKDAGIQTNAYFIIGLPDETEEEIMETYDFIRKSRLDTVTINSLVAFPGTPVWDYALKRNLVSDDMDWSKMYAITLSDMVSHERLAYLLKQIRRLCLVKRLKALPRSPWLSEAPRVAAAKLAGKSLKLINSLAGQGPSSRSGTGLNPRIPT